MASFSPLLIRILWVAILTAQCTPTFSQSDTVSGKSMDSCMSLHNVVGFYEIGNHQLLAKKPPIKDLVKYIRSCEIISYKYPDNYSDRGFTMKIPDNLTKVNLEFNDNVFGMILWDTGVVQNIEIHYNFDEYSLAYFFRTIKDQLDKAKRRKIYGREFWLYKDEEGRNAGLLPLDNYTYISYSTKDPALEKGLQEAIASFAWE
jgi:hypothetical protein